jgi:hypothetical protein
MFNRNGELQKNKEEYLVRFSMIPIYNSDNELSLGFYPKRYYRKQEKEQLIRDSKQQRLKTIFLYNISQPQSTIIKSY